MAINQITPESFFTPQQIIIGASSGFIIGILAGLVGLGVDPVSVEFGGDHAPGYF